jgi:hypothetical protein
MLAMQKLMRIKYHRIYKGVYIAVFWYPIMVLEFRDDSISMALGMDMYYSTIHVHPQKLKLIAYRAWGRTCVYTLILL